jgi:putative hydrolase of HD superfamily
MRGGAVFQFVIIVSREERVSYMIPTRLHQQLTFIIEIDKLKQIYRMNILTDESRHETDAEHSWHLSVMALLLAEYVDAPNLDILQVIKMALIHDLIEIYAGDTYCYDVKGLQDKDCREQQAAKRLFALLPEDQSQDFHTLWQEFEAMETPEAQFAAALDRLQPLLLHYQTKGKSWQKNGITSTQVHHRNYRTSAISKTLGEAVDDIINDAVKKGYLTE